MHVARTIRPLIFLLYLASATVFSKELSRDNVYDLIDSRFAGVPTITTEQLHDKLIDNPQTIIIDVRMPKEYAVSHLYHASNATDMKSVSELVKDKDAEIVFYCSVGYRSAAMTEKAIKAGYKNAVNLKGSIFQWANEGREVYSGERPVTQVHPFNKKWGVLLNEEYRSK